jgi:hypothetical protein
MSAIEQDGTPAKAPKHPYDEPFTAWPDPDRGFMVLDLRTMAWVEGPFRTPAEALEAMDRLNEQAAAASHAGERGTVLVVDDDEAIVDMLATALGEAGYRVLTAAGSAAIRLAADPAGYHDAGHGRGGGKPAAARRPGHP